MSDPVTIFCARKIITMNNYRPQATHIAVRDGRVLAVGGLDETTCWGDYVIDQRFADKVLMPGLVEGHAHASEGNVWGYPYVGYYDRRDPEGRRWRGAATLPAVIAILQAINEKEGGGDPDRPLFAWGFDPIYFGEKRVSATDLDRVSSIRPVLLLHSNGHVLNVNSRTLVLAGIDRACAVHGVMKDATGAPTGELKEMAAMYMVYKRTAIPFFNRIDHQTLRSYGRSCVNAGVTTATDLFATLDAESITAYCEVTAEPRYPIRLLPAMYTLDLPVAEGIARVKSACRHNHDKLRFGLCKAMADGSIQGFSGRLKWPGYFNGAANGLWNMSPAQLQALIVDYHTAGLQLHIHANGDEASSVIIDAIEVALMAAPRADHRHTLQHCQMADAAQFNRMATLGICVNLFANHIYYWGDKHYAITLGPDRAQRMDACHTAQQSGVHFAIHSDAPITPLGPLFTAWCAVNRRTASGRLLGHAECISVDDALRAITLGAAYTLKMDHLIGSLEPGKYADMVVLEQDPTACAAEALKDIGIWGTLTAGIANQAATSTD